MNVKLFSVYDKKAAAYGSLIAVPAVGVAVRSFSDVVLDKSTVFGKHPSDYDLYELGVYDQRSGKIKSLNEPLFVISGSSITIDEVPVSESLTKEYYQKLKENTNVPA